jgi:hypothetical protein
VTIGESSQDVFHLTRVRVGRDAVYFGCYDLTAFGLLRMIAQTLRLRQILCRSLFLWQLLLFLALLSLGAI